MHLSDKVEAVTQDHQGIYLSCLLNFHYYPRSWEFSSKELNRQIPSVILTFENQVESLHNS